MEPVDDLIQIPEKFAGRVRLFPLPQLVLLPYHVRGLHLFEPRYRQLFEDAMSDDQCIAMAMFSPGWNSQYQERPPIRPWICLGRVVKHQQRDDGTYDLMLMGVRAARVLRELPPQRMYREAEVELQPAPDFQLTPVKKWLRTKLVNAALQSRDRRSVDDSLYQVLRDVMPLEIVTNVIAARLRGADALRIQLLEQSDSIEQAQTLLAHLKPDEDPPKSTPSSWAGYTNFPYFEN